MIFVLVHGLGLSKEIWSELSPLLKGDVISVDLPGHGNSKSKDYSWNGIWSVINAAVGKKDWSDVSLVLHSFAACLIPEILSANVRPAKIILLEGILHIEDLSWSSKISDLNQFEYGNWLIRFRSVAEITLRSQLILNRPSKEIRQWSYAFEAVDGDALRGMALNLKHRLNSEDMHDAITKINSPILYARGRLNKMGLASIDLLRREKSIPIIEVPNSRHFPMIDNPIACSNIFLK